MEMEMEMETEMASKPYIINNGHVTVAVSLEARLLKIPISSALEPLLQSVVNRAFQLPTTYTSLL